MSYWEEPVDGFCESFVYGKPEWLNVFSSLFIVFFGGFGLFTSFHSNLFIKVILSSFTLFTNIVHIFGENLRHCIPALIKQLKPYDFNPFKFLIKPSQSGIAIIISDLVNYYKIT